MTKTIIFFIFINNNLRPFLDSSKSEELKYFGKHIILESINDQNASQAFYFNRKEYSNNLDYDLLNFPVFHCKSPNCPHIIYGFISYCCRFGYLKKIRLIP